VTRPERDLSGVDFVYLWADGIHVNVRLDDQKLCLLLMIGVRADGRKELVALTDGYRESAESWADLLRDCRRRIKRSYGWNRTELTGINGVRTWDRFLVVRRPTRRLGCGR
jgi:hypothetical protein